MYNHLLTKEVEDMPPNNFSTVATCLLITYILVLDTEVDKKLFEYRKTSFNLYCTKKKHAAR